ncbi:cytochrome c biogenesis protein ResB [Thermosulfuriphilus sp.]
MDRKNRLWRTFASVRLAIFLLITLAATSIIGTIIPQGKSPEFYFHEYGPALGKLIKFLHLYDTYHSWWFLTLLGLFCINLIICSLDRLPYTLELVRRSGIFPPDRLRKQPFSREIKPRNEEALSRIEALVNQTFGPKAVVAEMEGGKLFYLEKGRWTRFGVYFVHLSILIIVIGALIGGFFGFQAYLNLFEGETSDTVYSRSNGKPIPLGFEIRCDKFTVTFYDTGAPKEFRSDVTILNGGKEVLKKGIRVNDPLTFQGITFYQASYQSVAEIVVKVKWGEEERTFRIPSMGQAQWSEKKLRLGIMRFLPEVHGRPAAQVWMMVEGMNPIAFWLIQGMENPIKTPKGEIKLTMISADTKYMTGLQVKKDPGVWIVWAGCILMILGIFTVFFFSHQKMWVYVGKEGGKPVVIVAGSANKNRLGLERRLERLVAQLEDKAKKEG